MLMTQKGYKDGWFPCQYVKPVNLGLSSLQPKPYLNKLELKNTQREPKTPDAVGHVIVTIVCANNLAKKGSSATTDISHVKKE